jgi:hypothetical protein
VLSGSRPRRPRLLDPDNYEAILNALVRRMVGEAVNEVPAVVVPQTRRIAGRSSISGVSNRGAPAVTAPELEITLAQEQTTTYYAESKMIGDLAPCGQMKSLRSNCRCDVSASAEPWKVMHSCA